LCSRYSATVQKGRRFFALAGKDMELPNGKGGRMKVASKRQRAASPAAPAPEGGSPVEGEMAGELLAVPGAFRHVCRVRWERAASACRRVGGDGDTGGDGANGGGARGD
jgi:hypothetical protein